MTIRVCEAMNAPVGRLSDRTVCEANGGVLPRQVLIDSDGCPVVSDVMKNKTSCRTLPLNRLNLRLWRRWWAFSRGLSNSPQG